MQSRWEKLAIALSDLLIRIIDRFFYLGDSRLKKAGKDANFQAGQSIYPRVQYRGADALCEPPWLV
jgi:hypothetical protein